MKKNYWSYEKHDVFRYWFHLEINESNYAFIIKNVDSLFYKIFEKYDLFNIFNKIYQLGDNKLKTHWLDDVKENEVIGCFNWQKLLPDYHLNDVNSFKNWSLFKLCYFNDVLLVNSNFSLNQWIDFIHNKISGLKRKLWIGLDEFEMFHLPIDFRSNTFKLSTLQNNPSTLLSISISSVYNLWLPFVHYMDTEKSFLADNSLIATLNSARFNSLLLEIKSELYELGFVFKFENDQFDPKYVTEDGLLIQNKMLFNTDINERYQSIPIFNYEP